jgi:RNA polymerase sigma factor (sigma-70 family)
LLITHLLLFIENISWFFGVQTGVSVVILRIRERTVMNEKFNIIIPPQDVEEHPEQLKNIAKGDRKAFGWLYEHYSRKVYDLALLLTGDRTLSEDVVQDVFIKIWNTREKLRGLNCFQSWLHTMTKNHILDIWKRTAQERKYREVLIEQGEPVVHVDVLAPERRALMARAIDSLTPRQREVYRLVREHGMRRDNVSLMLGISPYTVRVLMQKALRGIRERLLADG